MISKKWSVSPRNSLLILTVIVLGYWFGSEEYTVQDNTGTQVKPAHQKKLSDYRELIDQAKIDIASMDQASDLIMLEDQELDQELEALDGRIGTKQSEFDKRYPNF